MFGRGRSGAHLATFQTLENKWTGLPAFAWLSDGEGWHLEKHYMTVRVSELGGKLFVFGRGIESAHLASFSLI